MLGHSPFLNEEFRLTSQGNDAKYLPIEQDPKLTIAQKLPHMERWYALNHAAMTHCMLERSNIKAAVDAASEGENPKLCIREQAPELIDLVQRAGVPLLIFSAGLADVIDVAVASYFLPACSTELAPTTHIFGNRMMWEQGEDGVERLMGFSALVHMFNKNMRAVPPDLQQQCMRDHCIVIGDGLGDAGMVDGTKPPPSTVLRIGLLLEGIVRSCVSLMSSYSSEPKQSTCGRFPW